MAKIIDLISRNCDPPPGHATYKWLALLMNDQRYRTLSICIYSTLCYPLPLIRFPLLVLFQFYESLTYPCHISLIIPVRLHIYIVFRAETSTCVFRGICKHTRSNFGHAVHAPPLYATVIVMSQTGDHSGDVEKGRGGESGVFSPFRVLIAVGWCRVWSGTRDRNARGNCGPAAAARKSREWCVSRACGWYSIIDRAMLKA
jgi:hypothetical protein